MTVRPFHRLSTNIPQPEWEFLQELANAHYGGNVSATVVSAVRMASELRRIAANGDLVILRDGHEQRVLFL